MAILDPVENIRAARAAGLPVGDPAKIQKIIGPAIETINDMCLKVDARTIDVFMSTSNIARIMLEKTDNPEWGRAECLRWRALFLDTLYSSLTRDIDRRFPE